MNFKESFLHFIWQYQLFDKSELKTSTNEDLHIIQQGNLNTNSGPDFLNCNIWIDEVKWFGAIEIHTNASDWNKHAHQNDLAYEKVVLHVVWNEDVRLFRNDGSTMPTLALHNKIDKAYILKYQSLVLNIDKIPCANHFSEVPNIVKTAMFDRVLHNRQEDKISQIETTLHQTAQSWEETTYRLLAKNFGFNINSHPFLKLAENLPYRILQKHRDNLLQIEALLFGVAGFLTGTTFIDEYGIKLQQEYQFLSHKYELNDKELNLHEWKYLRLRPANFPTIRIAQFAKLIFEHQFLFSLITDFDNDSELKIKLEVTQSEYWLNHFRFDVASKMSIGKLGKSSIENIIINTVVPLLFALSKIKNEHIFSEKAINLLEHLPNEKNSVTEIWNDLGFKNKNAFDSQASLELYHNFCSLKKCLNCSIGTYIMKK